MLSATTLNNWSWKRSGSEKWTPCVAPLASTSQIHLELQAAGVIPDPFKDVNERVVQWVGETDWEYKASFSLNDKESVGCKALVFDGLDTYATVFLNNKQILISENMFHVHTVNVNAYVQNGSNEVRIYFKSAIQQARDLEKKHGKMAVWNGEPCRVYTRRAQYSFGWDFGPTLLTCGPYRDIRFESYTCRLSDLYPKVCLSRTTKEVHIETSVKVTGDLTGCKVLFNLIDPNGADVLTQEAKASGESSMASIFDIMDAARWNSAGAGSQNLYLVVATIRNDKHSVLDKVEKRFGIRQFHLKQNSFTDQSGTSFFVELNGLPTYASGSNWIPGHSFQVALTEDDMRDWIKLIRDGNQNMIRIWGGGVYETDGFYDACDELGILIWHDFMFACGQYPCHTEFEDSVRKEIEDQLKRLRHHPSIVIYSGMLAYLTGKQLLKMYREQ